MDPAKRAEISSQAQALLLQNMVAVPLQANWIIYAVRSNVQDYHLDYMGLPLIVDTWLTK
jgi:ABC-type transport system substrate-binding protein